MNGTLPSWLANWLGVTPASDADAATWQLDTAWQWAPWATLLLLLAAAAWTVMLYARESASAGRGYRALLAGLRLAAMAILLVMLAQWALALRLTGPPTIALVIDRSASMNVADHYDDKQLSAQIESRLRQAQLTGATRLNLAKLLTTEHHGQLLRELSERFRLEVYSVAAGVERFAGEDTNTEIADAVRALSADGPDSQRTRLGDALQQVLDDLSSAGPAAVILFSDGVTTDGLPLASAAQEARRQGVPLFAVGLGSSKPPKDIELVDVLVDDAVFVDDLVSFLVRIKASGLAGESAKIALRRDGDAASLVEEAITLPPAGETLTTVLVDRPTTAGEISYRVEVAPIDDETNIENNRQQRRVAVRDEKIRVLLVQSYPNFEFRHLKTLLERDRTVELAVYLQDSDREFAEQDKSALRAFPVSREELLSYDVLLIGDVDPRLLPRSTWENLRAFVAEKGGGVAILAGPRFLPWSYADNSDVRALLPIELESLQATRDELPDEMARGFAVRPTPVGLQSAPLQLGDTPTETASIWSALAPLYWLADVRETKPAAQVWAVAATIPASNTMQRNTNSTPTSTERQLQSEIRNPQSEIPLILFQYFGRGRVLYHAIDSTWRWRLGVGDAYFARYWVQTIRFLARGKLQSGSGASLSADRREYQPGDTVQLRLRFLDSRVAPTGDEVTVLVDAAGERRRRVTLHRNPTLQGVFEGAITDLPTGQYETIVAEPRLPSTPPVTRFSVVAPPGELARLEMDASALTAAAEATRGKFYTIAEAGGLIADLPAGRRVPLENLPSVPLWNRWWLLAAFLACITGEWILRKRTGML